MADFVGGEGFGLSPELRELCNVFLTVPPRRELHPAVDSLNVSVATGTQFCCTVEWKVNRQNIDSRGVHRQQHKNDIFSDF